MPPRDGLRLPDFRYAVAFLVGFVLAGLVCLTQRAGAVQRLREDAEARVSAERANCTSVLVEERRALRQDADERVTALCVHPELRQEACRGR